MSKKIDLPSILPIFPLPKAILLPGSRLPLHIFEPRYLTMIEDCLKTPNRLIGMIQPTSVEGRLQSIGCAGKLTQFSETEDGRYMITLSGISRYRIESEVEGFTPYRRLMSYGIVLKRIVMFPTRIKISIEMNFLDCLKNFWRVRDFQLIGKLCSKQIVNF